MNLIVTGRRYCPPKLYCAKQFQNRAGTLTYSIGRLSLMKKAFLK